MTQHMKADSASSSCKRHNMKNITYHIIDKKSETHMLINKYFTFIVLLRPTRNLNSLSAEVLLSTICNSRTHRHTHSHPVQCSISGESVAAGVTPLIQRTGCQLFTSQMLFLMPNKKSLTCPQPFFILKMTCDGRHISHCLTAALKCCNENSQRLSETKLIPGTERLQALIDIPRSALCCHSNETRAPIANPPYSAQLDGTPYHSPSYIQVHAVVWECGEGQTDTQRGVSSIHFALAIIYAKFKKKQQNL